MNNKKWLQLVAVMGVLIVSLWPAAAGLGQPATVQAAQFDAKAVAEAHLKQQAAKYGFRADLSDLQYVGTVSAGGGHYVRYQQTVNGAPVFTRQVAVTLDASGKVLMVVSDYAPVKSVEAKGQGFTDADLEHKALAAVGAKEKRYWAANKREFGYVVENGTAIPAYRVVLHTEQPFGAWETYIHAVSGKVLKKKDLNRKVNGTGQVFLPNPVESQGSVTGLADNRDADSPQLDQQLRQVTLQGLDGSGYLRGQYATIKSKANTFSASNTFLYTRSDDRFEDVMAYHHLDSLQRYIQSLGFTNILNKPIVANVNTYKQDNSFYSPSTGELTFGSGGVDDAEDAGVIAHEYGHAIQDNQVPGFGNSAEGGAMGEGFGDYLGATHEDALSGSPYGEACVAEWDATSYATGNPPCLRRLDENKVYPQDWVGEVHADGEIWSQGLYEMAKAFGRDVATRIILQSHWSLTPNATFNDGARAIKQADVLLYGGAHGAQIDAIWAARGISTQ
jgi:Zn-dependent metalloprotease